MTCKILYVDLDNTLVDFQTGIDANGAEQLAEYEGRYDEVPGIFALMEPVPGAVAAYTELALLFDTYILSTAPWLNPSAWSHKLEWVWQHLGKDESSPAYKRLILSHHKNLNKGDFLVDDRDKNGAGDFEGTLVQFGSPEFRDWHAVLNYLRPLA